MHKVLCTVFNSAAMLSTMESVLGPGKGASDVTDVDAIVSLIDLAIVDAYWSLGTRSRSRCRRWKGCVPSLW